MNDQTMDPTATGMPLHCHICPKKPDFSDVSHLLTHIGSKGHLSHHFRLTITANSDPASKRLVDQYNEWFKKWNVEELMGERLDQKEKKKSGVASRGRSSRRSSRVTSIPSATNTPAPTNWAGRRAYHYRESPIDPQLGRTIKQEPQSRSGTPVSGFAMEAATFHRSYMPPMQSWPIGPYAMTPVQHERSVLHSMYSTPTSDSGETDFAAGLYRAGNTRKVSGSTRFPAVDEDVAEFDAELNDNVKLKGVIWPGMDLFDSATPEMRRKRNQKKTHSVLQLLQATSEGVEPIELVFDVNGVLRRERPVTGNPEEDDGLGPLPGETFPSPQEPPLKKKPARQPRKALAEKNVNSGRPLRNPPRSKHPAAGRSRGSTPYGNDQEHDNDDALTYGTRRPHKQRRVAVHRDISGLEATLHHPAPFATLTSGFRNEFQAAFSNAQTSHQSGANQRMPRRQPSISFVPAMTLSHHNPFNFAPPDFDAFSQVNGASLFQNSTLLGNNAFPIAPGARNGITFPPAFTLNPQPLVPDGDLFQSSAWTEAQSQTAWDVVGAFANADTGALDDIGSSFSMGGGDFMSSHLTNPLFVSNTHAVAVDDDATVSPPSERS